MSTESTTRADRRRLLIAIAATAVIVLPLGWMWWSSILPGSYSVMDMGYADYGGGPQSPAHGDAHQVSVADLTVRTDRPADVRVELTARKERFKLASGREIDGYTLNRRSPGPEIRAVQGQLVEVRLVNDSVPRGITLHWHGVDVPNAEDGVAGVTQDAVLRGQTHIYRFIADQAGTFWYHSHQLSHEQVRRGLLGALVITPRAAAAPPGPDITALSHVYNGIATVNGYDREQRISVPPGATTRVRLINTDNGVVPVWVQGAPYRVLAIDGYDLTGPSLVTAQQLQVPAGGRADLAITVPADGGAVRVDIGGGAALMIGDTAAAALPPATAPRAALDLLSYGSPSPLPFDASRPDRRFRYDIGRRPGFVHGRPGMWWSINGALYPEVPMYMVDREDVVRMTIRNRSGHAHPMHLHGHHAVVLSRNGVAASGSPWWVDSLEVASGDEYEIAFLADNPGIWMDHCHNLPHARQGLVAHLMYSGVTEPYRLGRGTPNEPE